MAFPELRMETRNNPEYATDRRLAMSMEIAREHYQNASPEVRAQVRSRQTERRAEIQRQRRLKTEDVQPTSAERTPGEYAV